MGDSLPKPVKRRKPDQFKDLLPLVSSPGVWLLTGQLQASEPEIVQAARPTGSVVQAHAQEPGPHALRAKGDEPSAVGTNTIGVAFLMSEPQELGRYIVGLTITLKPTILGHQF